MKFIQLAIEPRQVLGQAVCAWDGESFNFSVELGEVEDRDFSVQRVIEETVGVTRRGYRCSLGDINFYFDSLRRLSGFDCFTNPEAWNILKERNWPLSAAESWISFDLPFDDANHLCSIDLPYEIGMSKSGLEVAICFKKEPIAAWFSVAKNVIFGTDVAYRLLEIRCSHVKGEGWPPRRMA